MAHECPECGVQCHCLGDVGDVLLPDAWREANCLHCACRQCQKPDSSCECEEEDYELDEFFGED